ncbi:MAG: response regulator receiver modulated diguanylate cyclase [Deltaproteobacteria bacterium]|nr:response regulator receiver modulated diguanylate cyclase [Deltaproteobacteria bacterium]
MAKGKILVVDDSMLSRVFCKDILIEDGYEVKTASTGIDALEMIEQDGFDLVVTDLVLPDINGDEVLKRAKQMEATTSFIIMTAYASIDTAVECLKSGASDYLTKPLNPEEFKILVNRTIEQKRLFEENIGLKKLLKLYEVSRLISSCLDYDRFYEILLDSLLQVPGGSIGVAVFSPKEGSPLILMAWRGSSRETTAKEMADNLIKRYLSCPDILTEVTFIPQPEDVFGKGPLLVIPIKSKGEIAGYVAIFKSPGDQYTGTDIDNASFISEQASLTLDNVHLYNHAKDLIYIDELTRLHNVRYMEEALPNEIRRAKRYYGHSIGNKVLFEVAQVLKKSVRDIDIVIRYGGDEFTILLIETPPTGAMIIADRIRASIEGRNFLSEEGMAIKLTATLGIASFPEHAMDKETLTLLADKAMYKGKAASRNVVSIANNETSH